jgi:hypothetical protein
MTHDRYRRGLTCHIIEIRDGITHLAESITSDAATAGVRTWRAPPLGNYIEP